MTTIEERGRLPVRGAYDVIVAGGGVAGVAAALTARREGKRVLLLEKSTMLGGLATLGLINYFVPLCNGRGRRVIGGLCDELLRLAIQYGYDTLPDEWRSGEPGPGAKTRYVTRFSPHIFALSLTERIADEGVDLLFDTLASRPVMAGGHCEGLIVENKSGRSFYAAGAVVDTTGDADVLARAGVPTVLGRNYFTYISQAVSLESCRRAVEQGRIDRAVYWRQGGRATLYGQGQPADQPLISGTEGEEISRFLVQNQRVLLEEIKGEDRWSRDLVTLPGMAQFRTTRRIDGDFTLSPSDAYRHFDDSVAALCDFDRPDALYEAPLRCLVRSGFDNLVTAGRSASAVGYAWDVLRVIPPAIATGQAAGMAASLALESGRAVYALDVPALQRRLTAVGLDVHFDDGLLPDGDAGQAATTDEVHL